jgi:hypothetical protein
MARDPDQQPRASPEVGDLSTHHEILPGIQTPIFGYNGVAPGPTIGWAPTRPTTTP